MYRAILENLYLIADGWLEHLGGSVRHYGVRQSHLRHHGRIVAIHGIGKTGMPEEFQGFQMVREGLVRVSKTLARKVRDLT